MQNAHTFDHSVANVLSLVELACLRCTVACILSLDSHNAQVHPLAEYRLPVHCPYFLFFTLDSTRLVEAISTTGQ
jgi:hypothetical protein